MSAVTRSKSAAGMLGNGFVKPVTRLRCQISANGRMWLARAVVIPPYERARPLGWRPEILARTQEYL